MSTSSFKWPSFARTPPRSPSPSQRVMTHGSPGTPATAISTSSKSSNSNSNSSVNSSPDQQHGKVELKASGERWRKSRGFFGLRRVGSEPNLNEMPSHKSEITMALSGNTLTWEDGVWMLNNSNNKTEEAFTLNNSNNSNNSINNSINNNKDSVIRQQRNQIATLTEELETLKKRNHMLEFKTNLLLDMLTLSNLDGAAALNDLDEVTNEHAVLKRAHAQLQRKIANQR